MSLIYANSGENSASKVVDKKVEKKGIEEFDAKIS